MKRWIYILSAIVLLAIVLVVYLRKPANGKTQYRFAAVTRGELVRQVNATGDLEAVTTVTVGSQVSGTISALYVDFNAKVHKGQHLALLDTTFLATQVEEAKANLSKANAALNESKRAFFRAESLATQKLISSADYDNATTDYETAQANVQASKAQLLRAKTNLQYAHVNSPIDGTVVSRNVDVGQTVAASLSAPTLFTIAQDLAKMQLLAAVDEADVGQIETSDPVSFTVDAFPDRVFQGQVTQVRIAPTVQSNVVTYTVVIGVDNKDGKLLPGMTATVTIETARSDNAVKIASSATRFRPPADRAPAPTNGTGGAGQAKRTIPRTPGEHANMATVYTLSPDKQLVKKRVKIGLTTSSELEILEGLSEGDSVVVGVTSSEQNGTAAQSQTTNPFQPPRMGGGRGGR